MARRQNAAQPDRQTDQTDQTAKLKELSDMHDTGQLTDEEFAAAKAKLLGL